ncbi:MAG TPA: hypothetical protein VH062_06660 [Polyangiaceae bacterium]|jgi:hypothetical protein|nr:hypothetical protein [Polyangiaceae bacterium]
MTDAEDSAKVWTEQEQAASYSRAHEIAAKLRPKWDSARQEDAATEGWARWREESRGAPVDQYVRWAVDGDAKKRQHDSLGDHELGTTLDVDPEAAVDASRELAKIRGTAASAAVMSFELRDIRAVTSADLEPNELRLELGMLADRYLISAQRGPGGEHERAIASVLLALAAGADPAKWAGSARHWLETNNAGPVSRATEIRSLVRVVEQAIAEGATSQAIADRFVFRLIACPETAQLTTLPPSPWNPQERAEIVATVANAVAQSSDDPKATTRAALRALGVPTKKADDIV